MLTSCAVFLVPPAIGYHAVLGGFGIALGLVVGFALHTAGLPFARRRRLPVEPVVAELTAHALAAGAVLGVVYGEMPALGLLLGLAVASHKGPAGYAAARRLSRRERGTGVLLLPAAAVGLAALPAGLGALPSLPAAADALVFGFAAGVFLHVAMDFLPRCEWGGDLHRARGRAEGAQRGTPRLAGEHRPTEPRPLGRLRLHAVASTVLGALVVLGFWVLLSP